MKTIIRNILAVITGWVSGSIINMGLIQTGQKVFPMEDLVPNDMDAQAAMMPTLKFEYFIFPFLAHALGTLAGATIAGVIAASHKMKFSLAIGCLFLAGGITMSYMLPTPIWFIVLDLLIAYIPMAWIGGKIIDKMSNSQTP